MKVLASLSKPFFVLAPMDDVTDTVFRQIIADCAPPDVYFTEFVNVDALQSKGREATLKRLKFTDKERPLIAQLWGLNPENFYKTAREIADGTFAAEANAINRKFGLSGVQGSNEKRASRTNGTVSESRKQVTQQSTKSASGVLSFAQKQDSTANFSGIDLNFGCPIRNVVANGACSAFILPENREKAGEIIQAVRAGAPNLPLSVKTRTGYSGVDLTWHEFLLRQKLNMLTIHGRTKVQMSKVPADWHVIQQIRELRDKMAPETLIVGNGDVMSRANGEKLAKKHGLDGIMIGRGVFHDPFVFSTQSPWEDYSKRQKIELYRKHVELFEKTWPNSERKVHTLNKFCKIYIQGFDGAKELRERLMNAITTDELLQLLTT